MLRCLFRYGLVLAITLICPSVASAECNSSRVDYCPVSIVNLIANGEQYHGKKIEVRGVFRAVSQQEVAAVYLDRDSMKFEIEENGIFFDLPNFAPSRDVGAALNGRYVIVVGIFDAHIERSPSRPNGVLHSIVIIQPTYGESANRTD